MKPTGVVGTPCAKATEVSDVTATAARINVEMGLGRKFICVKKLFISPFVNPFFSEEFVNWFF